MGCVKVSVSEAPSDEEYSDGESTTTSSADTISVPFWAPTGNAIRANKIMSDNSSFLIYIAPRVVDVLPVDQF